MIPLRHYETPLMTTPFHARTFAHCRTHRWGPWAGYATVLTYEDTAMEYSAIRNAASLYDLCPMIKYRIRGPGAAAMLDRLTLRNVRKLAVGVVHYTAWCDDDGKLVDDGTLFRLGRDEFRLCCQERHLPWLLDSARGFDCTVTDETEAVAALSLQGPTSAEVLRRAGFDIDALRPFRMTDFPFEGGRLMVSRTGFTGDLGYELWTTPDLALPLWDHLMAQGAPLGLRPVGSDALNIARLEAGFILTHADFTPAPQAVREDRARSPLEMGLDWMIDWDKGHFTGRRALLRERAQGPRWAFVGLEIAGNVSAEGAILYHAKRREVGVVTGACWSPILKASIALAQVERRYAQGGNLWAEIYAMRELHYAKLMMRARVVPRPFHGPDRRRATPPGRF
ncbi:MAG: aminomethyltransferase family protein [Gemmobacter sp.]